MKSDVRQTLKSLVNEYGPSLADDRARLRGLLKDKCHGADTDKQIHWINTAAEKGVPQTLQAATSRLPGEGRLAQAAQRFEHEVGAGELGRWAVESWAIALGVVADAGPAMPAADASPQAVAPDDPFAEPTPPEPEEELRTAIRQALADGVVTEHERTWLLSQRERLGLSSTVASRLFAEEKTRATNPVVQPQQAVEGNRETPVPEEATAAVQKGNSGWRHLFLLLGAAAVVIVVIIVATVAWRWSTETGMPIMLSVWRWSTNTAQVFLLAAWRWLDGTGQRSVLPAWRWSTETGMPIILSGRRLPLLGILVESVFAAAHTSKRGEGAAERLGRVIGALLIAMFVAFAISAICVVASGVVGKGSTWGGAFTVGLWATLLLGLLLLRR